MSKTYNRRPLDMSIGYYEKQALSDRYYNINEFHGLNTGNNFAEVDQNSFREAKNVYVNSDNELSVRPPIVTFVEDFLQNDDEILGIYTINNTYMYHIKRNNKYLLIVNYLNTKIKDFEISEKVLPTFFSGYFVIFFYNNDSVYSDSIVFKINFATESLDIKSVDEIVYSAEDTQQSNIIGGSEKLIRNVTFDSFDSASDLYGKSVSIKIGDKVLNTILSNKTKYVLTNEINGYSTDDTIYIDTFKVTSVGSMFFTTDNKIYFSNSGETWQVKDYASHTYNNYYKALISDDGSCIYQFNGANTGYLYRAIISGGSVSSWESITLEKPNNYTVNNCTWNFTNGNFGSYFIADIKNKDYMAFLTTVSCTLTKDNVSYQKWGIVLYLVTDQSGIKVRQRIFLCTTDQYISDGVKFRIDNCKLKYFEGSEKLSYCLISTVTNTNRGAEIVSMNVRFVTSAALYYETGSYVSPYDYYVYKYLENITRYTKEDYSLIGAYGGYNERWEWDFYVNNIFLTKEEDRVEAYFLASYFKIGSSDLGTRTILFSNTYYLKHDNSSTSGKEGLVIRDDNLQTDTFKMRYKFCNQNIYLTSNYLYNYGEIIPFIEHKTLYPISIFNNLSYYFYDEGTGHLCSSPFTGTVEISYIKPGSITIPKFDKWKDSFLTFFAKDNVLYWNSLDSTKNTLYIPESNAKEFNGNICSLEILSTDSLAVFLENEIYIVKYSDGKTNLLKSKMSLGLKNGSETKLDYSGSQIFVPTNNGLTYISYQKLVSTEDQVYNYLTNNIKNLYNDYYSSDIKLTLYKNYLLMYRPSKNNFYLMDVNTGFWWEWETNYYPKKLFNKDNQKLYMITMDNKLFIFDVNSIISKDFSDKPINWNIKSQRLHLSAINNYKHISSVSLLAQSKQSSFKINLKFNNFRNIDSTFENDSMKYNVDVLGTFFKKVNFLKTNAFQFELSNDKSDFSCNKFNISNIALKYRVTEKIR